MTAGFSMAADWLGHISGSTPRIVVTKDPIDPILRDLHAMQDEETRDGARSYPPPRHDASRAAAYGALPPPKHNSKAHQPKPKFVAHKDPTRGKKGKDKVQSNRLGLVTS